MDQFKVNQSVRLKMFQGTSAPTGKVRDDENYWPLIGATGVVVSIDEPDALKAIEGGPRVLVRFDERVAERGLACHNDFDNSLWLRVSDLSPV